MPVAAGGGSGCRGRARVGLRGRGIGRRPQGVVLAAPDMAPEPRRSAALDRAHHLQLVEADVSAVGFTPSGTVVAENIRDLQSWPAHVGGAYAAGSDLCLFLGRWCVPPSCASGLSMGPIRPVATRV